MTKAEQEKFAALQAEIEKLQAKIKLFEKLQREAKEASECIAYDGLLEITEGTKVVFNNIEVIWQDNELLIFSLHEKLNISLVNGQKIIIKTQ